jgi:hypothetical protein
MDGTAYLYSNLRLYVRINNYREELFPSGAHTSGYGEWQTRGTRATQCQGV